MDWIANEIRNTVGSESFHTDTVFHYSIPVIDESGDGRLEPTDELGSGKTLLVGGEVLISKLNPRKARVLIAETHNVPTVCSGEFVVLQPRDVERRYLYWLLLSEMTRQELHSQVQSVTRSQQRARPADISKMWIEVPSHEVQRAIAQYLDTETARIDATVDARGKLVELLRERRRVVVMTLTTQGLRGHGAPHRLTQWPPLDIPPDWSLVQLRHLARVGRGASPRPIDDPIFFDPEGEFGWVRISDVTRSGRYLEVTEDRLSKIGASKSVKLEPGALILSIAASVGNPIITRVPCCIHDGFVYFSNLKALEPEYLYYLFLGGAMFGGLGKLGTQLNLNTDTIGDIRVPVPPREVQVEIVAALDERLADIDAAIDLAGRQVDLLVERRQALISAAVSGQLEISGVAA